MKHVSLAEARENIAELLDAVERGETVQISLDGDARTGSPRIVDKERRERARVAMDEIAKARKTAPRVTVEEILAWRDEGRRF